jgi:hypothetical protein
VSVITLKILDETIVPFDSGRQLPGRPTRNQIRAWADVGLLNRHTGQRVFLDWCHMGSTPVTSKEAHLRFLQALNAEST